MVAGVAAVSERISPICHNVLLGGVLTRFPASRGPPAISGSTAGPAGTLAMDQTGSTQRTEPN
jgi:hypothetical protein